MYRKTVYCEYDFWQEFRNACPQMLNPSERNLQRVQQWINIYSFLSKSNIVFDLSIEEFQTLAPQDEYLLALWKKSTEGGCGLKCKKNKFPHIGNFEHTPTSEHLEGVYLTTQSNDICTAISLRYGIIVLNLSIAYQATHIFADNGTAFPSPLAKDWNFMRGLLKNQPRINLSNSLIIADNYLLSDNDRIQYNLVPILKILLPETLAQNLPYQICIFTNDKRNVLPKRLSQLVRIIKSIRPKLDFQLMLYEAGDTFHDRAIITNNIWIGCGHGFDIFTVNGNIDKSTTINIVFPFLQSTIQWVDRAYLNLLEDAKQVDNKAELGQNYWGVRKHGNRLFEKH